MAANASGIRAGRAFVEIGTNDNALIKGLKYAEKRVAAFGAAITGIGARLGAIGGAITAPLLGASKLFADSGSALHDMAMRTGISVEALSALGYAAKQSGTDMETVESAIRRMQKALLAGSEENQQAAATFASLGMSVQKLAQLNPTQQFVEIGKAISQIPNPTMRAGAAMQVFGKSGTALLPMLSELPELAAEAKRFGLIMSTEDAAAADKLGDALDLMSMVIKSVVKTIGSSLAPMLTSWSISLSETIVKVKAFISTHKPLITVLFQAGVGLAAAGIGFFTLGKAIGGVSAVLGGVASAVGLLGTVFGAITSTTGLLVIGLGGLAAWFLTSTTVGVESMTWLGASFNTLLVDSKAVFKGISDAIKSGDMSLAVQILWTGLKVEWLKGTNALSALWADWSVATIEVFRSVSYKLASMMTDVWAGIQSTFTTTVSNLTGTWGTFVLAIINALFPLGQAMASVFGVDFDEAMKGALTKLGMDVENKAGKAALENKLGGIETNRTEAQKALKDQQAAENDARRQEAGKGLAKGAADLASAQAELAGLTGKAGQEAAAAGKPLVAPKGLPNLDLGSGIEDAIQKAKIDVSGSFSAAALRGLGAGESVQNDILKENKKTNDQLEKLNRKADVGRLVFQR